MRPTRRRLARAGVAVITATGGACHTEQPVAQQQEPAQPTGPPPAGGIPDDLPEIVADVEPSVVTVLVEEGLGSGVVFRDGGLVLTNQHVVQDAETVELALADGGRTRAEVIGTDEITDLAVLRAERTDLPAASFQTELPPPGAVVLALGSPLGFRNSVTLGIVSGVGREIPGSAEQAPALVDLIQTDAAISPGNSGGALVDTQGQVIGINDAYIPPEAGAVSLGFAIPAETAVLAADDLLDDGQVTHPFVGIVPGRVTAEIAKQLDAPTDRGVLVRDVAPDGPAAEAGLRPGDIITDFGDERIDTVEQFLGALRRTEPGQTVPVTVRRGGETLDAEITIGQQCLVTIAKNDEELGPMVENAQRIFGGHMGNPEGEIALTGTAGQVAERIQRHIDLGCTMFNMEFFGRDTREPAELFAKEVIPQFR
jgi:S1-C subfamily serine protease